MDSSSNLRHLLRLEVLILHLSFEHALVIFIELLGEGSFAIDLDLVLRCHFFDLLHE